MIDLHRILVPFDFSDASRHAARYACNLASYFGAEVTVLHVLPPLAYDFAMTQPAAELLEEVGSQRAAHARQALSELLRGLGPANAVRTEVVEGDAASEIVSAAGQGAYDAIVMSTRGAGAFRRWLIIGSVTTKVLHAVDRPVITSVHFEQHMSPLSISRMLCAVDLGPQSARVLCWASRAAQSFNAALTVVHAAPETHDQPSSPDASALAAARISELRLTTHVNAEVRIESGHPARVISELARQSSADLLVLGRGVSQDLLGRLRANAYDIIRQCPCPVVSV
jgi:nucleotide-binding universal stress UspA family protein